jgi:hypothetical protein
LCCPLHTTNTGRNTYTKSYRNAGSFYYSYASIHTKANANTKANTITYSNTPSTNVAGRSG